MCRRTLPRSDIISHRFDCLFPWRRCYDCGALFDNVLAERQHTIFECPKRKLLSSCKRAETRRLKPQAQIDRLTRMTQPLDEQHPELCLKDFALPLAELPDAAAAEDEDEEKDKEGFVCRVCLEGAKKKKLRFKDFGQMKGHVMRVHVKRYACHAPGCGKKFGSRWDLKQHLKVHEKGKIEKRQLKKRCESDECDSTFSSTKRLKRHVESVHKGTKQFGCQLCTKRFSSRRSLKIHTKKHTVYYDFSSKKV